MKTCPYCREEIQEEAIKCRYCHTMLISTHEDKKLDGHNVTYIVDKSIIRYGKFSLAVLGIFIVIGIVLFGFDIQKTTDNMKKAKSEMDGANKELKLALDELTLAKAFARKLREEVEPLRKEAKTIIEQLKQYLRVGKDVMSRLPQLSPEQERIREEKIDNNPELARTDNGSDERSKGNWKLWQPGQTIRIRFFGGDPEVQAKVERVAKEWTKYANIKFEFVSDTDAEVRISFRDGQGSWSFVGTDSLGIPTDDPTMNFGWLTNSSSEQVYSNVVLHNFGHMLGLIHEHQSPNAEIPWDKEAVYRYYFENQGWGTEQVDSNLLRKSRSDDYPSYREFDVDSIMMYPIDNEFTEGDFEVGQNYVLSNSDKDFIANLYPHN